jgi:1-deoxy-D-xylulose-5-phosphate synthase
MEKILPQLESPADLKDMPLRDLKRLAAEIRETLVSLGATRPIHFASNLGVVELAIALHSTFDFAKDRLIWDTGHQIYPHKLLTGRFEQFETIRTRGGLMGYPNPAESDYDLLMTGHAGSSISTVLGLKVGDELMGETDRRAVAVIGDGAFPSGIVYEAMNNAGGLKKKMVVILNDNKMSICPRVGGMGDYLDRLRANPFYTGLKTEVQRVLNKVPLLGDPVERFLAQMKDAVKAGLHGGMLFEELGFRYIGPIDGHHIGLLKKYLKMVSDQSDPVLLHVVTEKGHGVESAAEDPAYFHTPPVLNIDPTSDEPAAPKKKTPPYTKVASDAIVEQMQLNERVTVMTAAMCQGNQLQAAREQFPDRFFDTGICEAHTVAFAAGQAKAGLRPIVEIYSTFLQRSFDQIFQEVSLQNLPVTFMLDRAGLTGPDGPTHHGVFDLAYQRVFPNMIVMAPGDAHDLTEMLATALRCPHPCSIRYPKAAAETVRVDRDSVEIGRAEVFDWGNDGMIVCCGAQLTTCLAAAQLLREEGVDVGVINARFAKPLDRETILKAIRQCRFVVTVEEGALTGGFGSAVLEAAADAGVSASHVRRLGIPDRYVEHGDRAELLADLGLDLVGILDTCRTASRRKTVRQS